MHVVGKFGSLISQGVYSVATPFHPFGGAVDVIVVQQQDGTFRSTPWYVRFGKFQGVLKGAEKIVSVEVNGVEAKFHMYLDACGEAYFVKEAESLRASQRKGVLSSSGSQYITRDDNVCRLEHSLSDTAVVQLGNDYGKVAGRLDRSETRFYDFQDEQPSFEGSDNLSECESNLHGSLDGEPIGEVEGSDSEVVLVSVDGRMLTAPVLASEQAAEPVQASAPQFHLESTEATVLLEGNEEFNSREDECANGHASDSSIINEGLDKLCSINDDPSVLRHQLEVCEDQVEYSCGTQEIQNLAKEDDPRERSDVEEASGNKEGDVPQSCLEALELATVSENNDSEEKGYTLETLRSEEIPSDGFLREETGDSALEKRDEDEKSCASEALGRDRSPPSQTEVKPDEKHILDAENEEMLDSEKTAPVLGMAAFDLDLLVKPTNSVPLENSDMLDFKDDSETISTSSSRKWSLWPIPFRRVKAIEHNTSSLSKVDAFVDSESCIQSSEVESAPMPNGRIESPRNVFIRTNVPTNEQIESLNLKDGQNMVTFSFSTRVLGRQQVDAHIFLWRWDAKIVISDVDGTITKSDVLGQFMPLVGKDWTQTGVTNLFSAIRENGYQLLFLSARAIAQAYLTRNFLLNLKQDGKGLPIGPVVISPDGLFPSLFREVIRRAPHEFKIACLEDIKKLFPPDHNPFYAGFGNRDTDELSYLKIGIPKGKIFIINPKGEVVISHHNNVRSYTSLHTLVNNMFPPTSMVEQEDYNMWNFWKMPLPDIN